MNIHPIFVHFPIALLTIYAVAELIRFEKIKSLTYWFYVKAILVIVGVLSSFLALSTGEQAEHLQPETLEPLIETHATFANISTWIFVFLAAIYLVSWVNKSTLNNYLLSSKFAKIWNIKVNIANKVINSYLTIILAFVGLISITITGALGGAIVYGPDVDPIVSFVYKLFF